MAQSKTIAGVPDSQSPHPDSCSFSSLHPFFSTKIGFYILSFYSTSFYFCIFALSSSAFMKVREMFFKLLSCSLPLVDEEMFQFLLHWSMQPCKSTHTSTTLEKGVFPETYFMSQGVTSLTKLMPGRAPAVGAKLLCLSKRVGALRPYVANGVCWRVQDPHPWNVALHLLVPLKNIWVTTESAAHGKSTDFHHEIKPSLKQPEISGKRVLHSKCSLCCSVTAESSFAVAGFEAQLTNCYWANWHHSRSIPGGTEALPHHGEAPILPPLFPRLCKKMANKHRTFFSHATFPSCKEWLQTSADPPFWSFLGGTILTFLL